MTAFSIFEKIFLKIENLMCVLRTHINRTLYNIFTLSKLKVVARSNLNPLIDDLIFLLWKYYEHVNHTVLCMYDV